MHDEENDSMKKDMTQRKTTQKKNDQMRGGGGGQHVRHPGHAGAGRQVRAALPLTSRRTENSLAFVLRFHLVLIPQPLPRDAPPIPRQILCRKAPRYYCYTHPASLPSPVVVLEAPCRE